jgi:hypothetical protein
MDVFKQPNFGGCINFIGLIYLLKSNQFKTKLPPSINLNKSERAWFLGSAWFLREDKVHGKGKATVKDSVQGKIVLLLCVRARRGCRLVVR